MNILSKIVSFFLLSSQILCANEKDSYQEVLDVIQKYSAALKKEQGIILRSYGLSYAGKDKIYDGKIHRINLGYSIDQRMEYTEGRALFYSVVNNLLVEINNNLSLKIFFYNYPVGFEDLRIKLSFDYDSKEFLKKNDVYMINILDNQIMYFFVQEDGKSPEVIMERSDRDFSVGYEKQNLRSIIRDLPEDPEAAKFDK